MQTYHFREYEEVNWRIATKLVYKEMVVFMLFLVNGKDSSGMSEVKQMLLLCRLWQLRIE